MTLDEINKIRASTGDAPLANAGIPPVPAQGSQGQSLSDRLGVTPKTASEQTLGVSDLFPAFDTTKDKPDRTFKKFEANTEGGISTIPENLAKTVLNIPSNVEDIVKGGSSLASDAVSGLLSSLKDKGFMETLKDVARNTNTTITDIAKKTYGSLDNFAQEYEKDPVKTYQDLAVKLSKFSIEHPVDAGLAVEGLTPKSVTSTVMPKIEGLASDAKTAITDITKTKDIVPVAEIPSPNIDKIQEIISPKITSKETRKIIDEGRLTRGNESTIFGKQPDIIEQSDVIKRGAETIDRHIPDAHKMNDAQLTSAINQKTTEMAQSLSGDMKNVPVKPETTGKVVERWKQIKAEQMDTPEFLDNEAGNRVFQKKFENYLKQLEWDITDETGKFKSPTPKSMDDVWSVRKAYDESIPANVKNATEASSPVLQGRKAMWLQNRSLLNAAINDTAEGMGEASKNAFRDMSDMYDAKENILSKAKIDLKGEEGVLPSTTKGWLRKAGYAGATLIGGKWVLDQF